MKEFKLSDEQVDRLMAASRPVPYLVMCGSLPASPQENANRVWRELGEEMGFVWDSAKPVPGKGVEYFTAKEVTKP